MTVESCCIISSKTFVATNVKLVDFSPSPLIVHLKGILMDSSGKLAADRSFYISCSWPNEPASLLRRFVLTYCELIMYF